MNLTLDSQNLTLPTPHTLLLTPRRIKLAISANSPHSLRASFQWL